MQPLTLAEPGCDPYVTFSYLPDRDIWPIELNGIPLTIADLGEIARWFDRLGEHLVKELINECL